MRRKLKPRSNRSRFFLFMKFGGAWRYPPAAPFNSETANSEHDYWTEELVAFVPLVADELRRVGEHRAELRAVTIELGFGEKAPELEPIRDLPLRYDLKKPSPYTPIVQRSESYYEAPAPRPEIVALKHERGQPVDAAGYFELVASDVAYVAAGLEMGLTLESLLSAFGGYRLRGEELVAELRRRLAQ